MNITEIKIINKNTLGKYIIVNTIPGFPTTSEGISTTSGTIAPTAIVQAIDIGGSTLLEVHPVFDPVSGGASIQSFDPCARNTSFSRDSDHETTNHILGTYSLTEDGLNNISTYFPDSNLNGSDLHIVAAVSDFLSTGYNIILKLTDKDKKIINFLSNNYKKLCQKY